MIIKVCGMREPDNIRAVEQLGTDWMGVILYNRSPRFASRTPEYLPVSCRRVGVFVNATPAYLYNKVKELRLDIVQLHGHESPSLCAELRQYGLTVVKAFPVESEKDLELTVPYEHCCDYFLFDKRVSTFGGSGQSFPWNVLDAYQASVPFLLSGGLSPDSLAALRMFHHPRWAGIDLNSCFETAPGVKDIEALRRFIRSFRDSTL